MSIQTVFAGWHFDIKSALLTILGVPLSIYFLAIIRKYLKSLGTYTLEGVMYWLSRSFKRSLAGALTLKQYCRLRLADENRYLFVPSSLDIKLPIDEVFVTLSLGQQGEKGDTYNHRDLLSIGNRIRVIGDPGSGKSSLIKRLFRDACFKALDKPKHARLPILIELKTLLVSNKHSDEKLGEWFVQKLREHASKTKVYQMQECFDTYAENSGLLVLLDGLDEVSSLKYAKVQAAIVGLSRRLAEIGKNNTLVLTMRTQFHQQVKDAYRDCFGPALFLQPFSPTDIYDFLTRWPFRKGTQANIARIYGELTDRPTLREMCSNPLILSMYVAEDQAAGHVVAPESRTEFYRKVTEELIIKRRLQQTGPTPAYTTLREQRERILGKLAYEHMINVDQPANLLSFGAAVDVIVEVIQCSKQEAKVAFNEIAKETGLISEERPGQTFRFIHLTFCEFLAGFDSVHGQPDGWAQLINIHRIVAGKFRQPELRSRLVEVIPFACGLLPRIHRERAISDVATLGDDSLLARCFLETKQYTHHCWPEFIERKRRNIVEAPEQDWDERWLRELHLFNVVVKDATECSTHMPVAKVDLKIDEFFEALAGSQKESLSKVLAAYAAQDAAAAFRLAEVSKMDLANDFPEIVISHCDQAPFLALCLERAVKNSDQIVRWAPLIVEAALRSRIVAVTLNHTAVSDGLRRFVAGNPCQSPWYRSGLLSSNSLYIYMLSIATSSGGRDLHFLPFLKILKKAPSPLLLWTNPRIFITLAFLFFITLLALIYTAVNENICFIGLYNMPALSIPNSIIIAFYALMPFMLISSSKRRLFRSLIFPWRPITRRSLEKASRYQFLILVNFELMNRTMELFSGKDLRTAVLEMRKLRESSSF